ncbi:MAG: hypothetical protein UX89_C0016G0026 [Parcubacteria group bacterium GW2011_GWA2_47_16]|nr:MAG: hypothetical protein UX89_C0016G0026 [Parcubacteria group bacterium GW2011_GWA2_47_16]
MATTVIHDHNDGRDDPIYQAELAHNTFNGQRLCLLWVIAVAFVGLILSSLAHFILFKVLPENIQQAINFWVTFPLGGIFLWLMGIAITLSMGNLWLLVKENHVWIVIDPFGRGSKKMKFGTGFYLIPWWWLVKPENLVNLEKITRNLPDVTYPALDSKGAAKAPGSYIYQFRHGEAEDAIGLGLEMAKIEKALDDSVVSRIGPEIRKFNKHQLGGDTTAITDAINATFLGDDRRDALEQRYHLSILTVMVSGITLDEPTRRQLDREVEAETEKAMIADKTAALKEGLNPDGTGGTYITDETLRYDIQVALGKDPKRVTDRQANEQKVHITTDVNTSEALKGLGAAGPALLAGIAALVALKGGGGDDKDKGGKKPKK